MNHYRSQFLKIGLALPVFLLGFLLSARGQYEYGIFRGSRIVNGHSVETLRGGEMEFIIGHRFGRLNGGAYELFGLDQANIRLGLDFGLKDWLTIGGGRSSLGKEFDGFLKLRVLRQGTEGAGIPVSVTAFSSMAYNSLHNSDPERPLAIQNRLAYVHQLLIARKINDRISIQLMPTLAHYNLVDAIADANDKIAVGAGGKYQLAKNLALTAEYYYPLPGFLSAEKKDPLSIGIDLNTGSHVFQLHFTNAAGMIEKQFIGETTGSWGKGDIHFGFNMVRTFKLKGRRY
ncbi:MAG: DUF5777 family beta-barrel protein [Saprospiraceae bacterium]